MNELQSPSPALRARLLAAARRTPAAPPGAWRRRLTGAGLFALVWTVLAALLLRLRVDWQELPAAPVVETVAGLAGAATLAAVAGVSRGPAMTGPGVARLRGAVTVALLGLVALVTLIDPSGPSTRWFSGAAMGRHAVPCGLIVLGLGVPLLVAGLAPLRGLTLARPGLTGACIGLGAATVAHLVIRLHCAIGGAGHAVLGHLIEALPLMMLGAWASRARVMERLAERFSKRSEENGVTGPSTRS
jgi:hypothetical protein